MMVNGEAFDLGKLEEASLPVLIRHLQLSPERVAVELNGDIIPRNAYAQTRLSTSDIVEIIHYVGGG